MKKLTLLFLAGFAGAALTGCSSTPKQEKKADQAVEQEQQSSGQTAAEAAPVADDAAVKMEALKQKIVELRKKRVHFDFDKSNIKPEYYDVIRLQAQFMNDNPQVKVTVAGYCDERGTVEYNLALGERRANAAYNALVAEGVSPDRIQVISYGESYPLDPRHNEEAWAQNRRATFVYGIGEFVRPH